MAPKNDHSLNPGINCVDQLYVESFSLDQGGFRCIKLNSMPASL